MFSGSSIFRQYLFLVEGKVRGFDEFDRTLKNKKHEHGETYYRTQSPDVDASPKISGSDQRHQLMLDARNGIQLNIDGGRGYDRNMRRLVADGLCKIERENHWRPQHRRSRLVLTSAGKEYLLSLGIDPNPTEIS